MLAGLRTYRISAKFELAGFERANLAGTNPGFLVNNKKM
jgi:hypothetical protein